MSEQVESWGELCDRADIDPGDTPSETPVRKLISGGAVIGAAVGFGFDDHATGFFSVDLCYQKLSEQVPA